MTNEEMVAGSAILGGMFATVVVFTLLFYILTVIANWKMFTKAGVAGWKSIIPVYNVYVLYKICGISFLKDCILPAIIGSVFSSMGQNADSSVAALCSLVYLVALLYIDIKLAIALSKAFGKGTGFTVGLVLFPNIFQLILGFGSAQYVGDYKEN